MKKLSWKQLVMILSLSVLAACGGYNDDDDDDDDLVNEELPQEEEVRSFSTRINNNLLIAGTRCQGNETTTEPDGDTVTCADGQWLITVDNVNTCTPGGGCTEVAVVPFVAELDRVDRVTVPEFTFFEIDPISQVSSNQASIINDYFVRFDLNDDEATVVPR